MTPTTPMSEQELLAIELSDAGINHASVRSLIASYRALHAENERLRQRVEEIEHNRIPIEFYAVEKDPVGDVMVRTHDGQFCRRDDFEASRKQYEDACIAANLAEARLATLEGLVGKLPKLVDVSVEVDVDDPGKFVVIHDEADHEGSFVHTFTADRLSKDEADALATLLR